MARFETILPFTSDESEGISRQKQTWSDRLAGRMTDGADHPQGFAAGDSRLQPLHSSNPPDLRLRHQYRCGGVGLGSLTDQKRRPAQGALKLGRELINLVEISDMA